LSRRDQHDAATVSTTLNIIEDNGDCLPPLARFWKKTPVSGVWSQIEDAIHKSQKLNFATLLTPEVAETTKSKFVPQFMARFDETYFNKRLRCHVECDPDTDVFKLENRLSTSIVEYGDNDWAQSNLVLPDHLFSESGSLYDVPVNQPSGYCQDYGLGPDGM